MRLMVTVCPKLKLCVCEFFEVQTKHETVIGKQTWMCKELSWRVSASAYE
jgi:hypothetical protein